MRDERRVYAILAVVLPVALGLGVIYLYAMGSLDANAVILIIVGMVALVPAVGLLIDLAAEGDYRHQEEARLRRLRRTYAAHRSPIDSSR